jgi:phosphatidylinositol glycan class B
MGSVDPEQHVTQQDVFYRDPVAYMRETFPSPPLITAGWAQSPSHVLVFGDVLPLIQDELQGKGYQEVWYGWNGFDIAQDESERRGGVRVWRRA